MSATLSYLLVDGAILGMPLIRERDGELLGLVGKDNRGWQRVLMNPDSQLQKDRIISHQKLSEYMRSLEQFCDQLCARVADLSRKKGG